MQSILKKYNVRYCPSPHKRFKEFLDIKRKQNILLGLFILFLGLSLSCTPEEERINNTRGLKLFFSTDTIKFDTVFTGSLQEVRNITKRLMVFNTHERALEINSLTLGRGNTSPYTLFVNGQQAQSVNNELLLGGDSLLILINLQVEAKGINTPFLIKDSILFEVNENIQDVKLWAHGQDASFVPKGILPCDQTWDGDRPYVIQDTVWVDAGCTLTIGKGAKLFFNNNAALRIAGTLKVLGEPEAEVLFSNSRLDIKNEAGLWAGVHFLPESHDNEIYFATIRNATTGIFVETNDTDTLPDLIIGNTKIENMAQYGIYAKGADLYVYNSLINTAFKNVVKNEGGGNYTYEHCTMANYAVLNFSSQQPTVSFNDAEQGEGVPFTPLKVKLYNNIIWSDGGLSYKSDLDIAIEGDDQFIDHGYNLIRSVEDNQAINHNIIDSNRDFPKFIMTRQYNYQLDSLSPAINKGKHLGIMNDIMDNERDDMPDIGAYEYVVQP